MSHNPDLIGHPNYKEPIPQLYTRFAYALICQDASLRILQAAGTGFADNDPDMPSWVPDWRHGPRGCRIVTLDDLNGTSTEAFEPTTIVARMETRGLLEVDRIQIDEIRKIQHNYFAAMKIFGDVENMSKLLGLIQRMLISDEVDIDDVADTLRDYGIINAFR